MIGRMMLAAMAWTAVVAGAAEAQAPRLQGGAWSGAYTCSQGLTGMTVALRPAGASAVDATVTFYAHPDNPGVESGCYAASGRYDAATGRLVLNPGAWIHRPGDGWRTTVLDGAIAADGAFTGRVLAPGNPAACTTFALRRGAAPFKPPPPQCTRPALVG
ncbi:MAG: hypothetical protein NW200_02270 [Hyphomonadaceae bacterium]|nr:hypothetical protein [Hyphomonadaceae bacterium]